MKRKNATRNALFMSIISLVLCVSMLVGTTFAWFTDSVESGRNIITAGNLDIELYNDLQINEDKKVKSDTKLFNNIDGDLWEPGAVTYENLTVANVGNLELKYTINLSILEETTTEYEGETYKLGDAIKVGLVDNGITATDRNGVIASVSNWKTLSDFALNMNDVRLEVDGVDTFGIVLYWQPDVDYTDGNRDNIFNLNNDRQEDDALKLEIGVNLFATQVEAESDSFGSDYDKNTNAKEETGTDNTIAEGDGSATLIADAAPSEGDTTVEAPAGAFEAYDKVEIEVTTANTLFNVTSQGGVVASLDVTLTVNGEEVSTELEDGKVYTVTTYISKRLNVTGVKYTGTDGKDQPTLVSYDAETGKLVFTTNHFSEYAVSGTAYGYDEATDTAYATAQDVIAAIVAGNDPTVPVEDKQAVKDAAAGTSNFNAVVKAISAVQNTTTNKWYISLDKAMEAVQSGETLKLLEDIETTSSYTIPAGTSITLDMNGKAITATDTKTSDNYQLFYMDASSNKSKSTMTVKGNGTIVLTATTDRDWNNLSAIFHNRGGELNIQNGTFIHKGGTDMAFVVDNSTNWIGTGNTATLNVKGGKLESSYTAIRNRLDNTQNSGHGIVNISGGEIIGASRGIWAQLSSKPGSGEINVSGGTITGGKNAIRVDSDTGTSTVSVNVNNATINGEVVPGCASCVVNGVAYVSSAEALADALANGGNVVLSNNIEMPKALSLSNANFTLDGNGYTITMADGATNTYALFDITGGKATIKNVTFDGIKEGAIVRTVGVEFNADNVTAVNGNHTQVQGLFRLLGKSTITNSTFKNNTCNMVISLNYDGANNDPQVVKNCVFEGNICNATGVLYYVKGESCTLDGNEFVGNTVNCNGNGATVYMGFTEGNTITNNVFKNNVVNEAGTSKRVAGALMVGYETIITNNAFVDNKVEGTNAKANDVCASVYYTDIDLSGNYWGGGAPVENDDYFVEYPDNNKVIINGYLTSYEF